MRFLICFMLLLVMPSSTFASSSWWSEKWPNRLGIIVESPVSVSASGSTGVPGALDNVVLVKLHGENFPDFFLLQENLADLRFMAEDDKTPLKFHVDSFDLINQFLFVWVHVPVATAGTPQKIWMYYGNAEAVAATEGEATFDVTQAAVFHFRAAEPAIYDATAYKTQAAITGVEVVSASLIGAGLKYSGDGQFTVQDSQAAILFDSARGVTFSAWLKPSAFDTKPMSILSRTDVKGNSVEIFADANAIYAQITNSGKTFKTQTAKSLPAATWSHFALVLDKTTLRLFMNGEELKTATIDALIVGGPINVGAKTSLAAGFKGEMDEIRFANVALSQNALSIAVKNQGIVDEIVIAQQPEKVGEESAEADGHMALVGVIFKNTDIFGWSVLIVLGIMFVISVIVIVGKAFYLGQVRRDNTAFLKEYAKLIEVDPATLDKEDDKDAEDFSDAPILQAVFGNHDHYQSSTIYHLYHRGIHEIKNRSKTIQEIGLTTRAANALRATIDAQLVREVQRLNSLMVLLTISISGGPFIGLFGTVMGVMMTFAAIAKTGDVNIAAIAPGVAAALLATLGGLLVAIPALFAYNYLSSKIKESIADMRVFSDEFTTRLSEYYGRS